MPGDFKALFTNYKNYLQGFHYSSGNADVNFINKALLSIFDSKIFGSNDGVISEFEFKSLTENEYSAYVKEMKDYYKSTYGKDLEYHIPSYYELQMLLNTEKPYDNTIGHLFGNKITQKEMTEFILPDGMIGQTKQGGSGDCYIESPLISLSCTTEGQNLISRSIKPVNGGYHVTLYGARKKNGKYVPLGFGTSGSIQKPITYFFSQKQLKAAQEELLPANGSEIPRKKYNSGDPDMILIAMAIEKYRTNTQTQPTYERNRKQTKGYDDYLSSGEESIAVQLVTGKSSVKYTFKEGVSVNNGAGSSNAYKKRKHPETTAMACFNESIKSSWRTCSFAPSSNAEDKIMKKYNLESNHAYAITNINTKAKTVTLVNPWRGKRNELEKITIPYSDFVKVLCDLSAFDT